jgi:hypothetical protein
MCGGSGTGAGGVVDEGGQTLAMVTQRQDAEALCGGSVVVCSPFSGASGIVLVYAPPQRVLSMDSLDTAATSCSLAAETLAASTVVFFFKKKSIVYGDGVLKHPLCKPFFLQR